jgi:hypothetical protein
MVEHAPNHEYVAVLPNRLFNAALTVVQESKALSDLQTRFASGEALTEKSSTAFHELVRSHSEKLLAAVEDEETILSEVGLTLSGVQPSSSDSAASGQMALNVAEQNLALCKELTTGPDAQTRPAQSIFPELAESITHLRDLVQQLRSDLQDPLSDRNEKK